MTFSQEKVEYCGSWVYCTVWMMPSRGGQGQMITWMDRYVAETHLKAFGEISRIATAHHFSVYAATYLELAVSERLPIATKDEALKAAARKCGVKLLLEG
jgi:hypothetical protein